jgi:hypothetical protein
MILDVLSTDPPFANRTWYKKRRRRDCEIKDVVKREEGEIASRSVETIAR